MTTPAFPYIIDVEASGFGPGSYPIEIGLALEPGRRYCTLIRPADHWVHWDSQAESVHNIRRGLLVDKGRPIDVVAAELNRLLDGQVVYSDAWALDLPWIDELYTVAGIGKRFRVGALETLLTPAQTDRWMNTRDSVVSELGLDRHRASNDSRIVQETYRRLVTETA